MTKRRWASITLKAGCAAVALVLAWLLVVYSAPLAVTVRNASGSPLGDLVLVSGTGHRTAVSTVVAGSSDTVRPRLGSGEDQLMMVDAQGREYVLLGYFEGNPGGRVIVTIDGVSGRGLAGRVSDDTHYFSAGESILRPMSP